MTIIFILENIFILMILFWVFSWLGDRFYKSKFYIATTEVYECGFITVHNLRLHFNFAYLLIAWLLILYDIEFFFLIPFFFNLSSFSTISVVLFWFFWLIIVLSFYFDWSSVVFRWLG